MNKHHSWTSMCIDSAISLAVVVMFAAPGNAQQTPAFDPFETTIPQIEAALTAGTITCTQLVQWYLNRMDAFDIAGPTLNAVRVRNSKALQTAASYDQMPKSQRPGPLFCVPMVVKDNIDTVDMPTTAGSVALQNTFPLDDNFLVKRLKAAGVIVIAKGNLTEFANYLTNGMPAGYSSLGGYVLNPYDPRPIPVPLPNSDGRQALTPSGSSSGPAVVSSSNLAAAAIGTETSGSILSPSNANSDVGIKPTVGLISRQGVVPIAASQDTAGPITRTVTDAAILLGVLTGVDSRDPATISSIGNALSDYTPYLRADGLNGARIGVPQEYWATLSAEQNAIGQAALQVMRNMGATVVNVSIASFAQLNAFSSSVLQYEFKRDLDTYLASRGPTSPIKTLADVIAYNSAHAAVALKYGQVLALASQATDLYAAEPQYISDRAMDLQLAKVQGIDAAIDGNNLTALVFPGSSSAGIAAKAGYPTVIVPAGYLSTSSPYGIGFTGKAYTEATLISLAYSYEQATKLRQPPGSALRLLPVSTQILPAQVVNYASAAAGSVAPGEMVAINGFGMGPAQAASLKITANNHIDTSAGTTRVLFDGVPAPIVSAQAAQVVAIVPYGVSGKTSSKVTVEYNGQVSAPLTVQVTDVAPGIFTNQPLGKGSPLVVNIPGGTQNSPANPAPKGSVITFFVTGEGLVTASGSTLPIDGRLAAAPLQTPVATVAVSLNSQSANVIYAGALPGSAGIMQVNVQLDANEPSGTLPLVVQVGSKSSQTLNVSVQ
ncbi:Amidase (modular protein) [Candidatus Sulfopaludibacter sp. SbA4]|nr:Amidase (modular protein) [Candidatus Sulfopaludibacter sp. SbA4]